MKSTLNNANDFINKFQCYFWINEVQKIKRKNNLFTKREKKEQKIQLKTNTK